MKRYSLRIIYAFLISILCVYLCIKRFQFWIVEGFHAPYLLIKMNKLSRKTQFSLANFFQRNFKNRRQQKNNNSIHMRFILLAVLATLVLSLPTTTLYQTSTETVPTLSLTISNLPKSQPSQYKPASQAASINTGQAQQPKAIIQPATLPQTLPKQPTTFSQTKSPPTSLNTPKQAAAIPLSAQSQQPLSQSPIPPGQSKKVLVTPLNKNYYPVTKTAKQDFEQPLLSQKSDGGLRNDIFGEDNVVDGSYNGINGNANNILGDQNLVQGDMNSAEGKGNSIWGKWNAILGADNGAKGNDNIIAGSHNTALGDLNNFRGISNIASGNNNQLSGTKNVVKGDQNDAFGELNKIKGNKNGAYGNDNQLKGISNEVVGDSNDAFGIKNKIQGDMNGAYGSSNVVAGSQNKVKGALNNIVGSGNTVRGRSTYPA